MKVIGAGLGRTGTYSLKLAIEQLGFGPCFHMKELFELPDRAAIFTAAYRGDPVDWEQAFDGFRSTLDWPSCTFYDQLARRYPESKVILTTRDPEKWHRSCMDTIAFREGASHDTQEAGDNPVDQMIDAIIWRGTFDRRFDVKDHAISIFNRHSQSVIKTVPSDRLLIYQVSEGWGPLCRFLEVPIPEGPFPHENDTASFRKDILGIEEPATAPAV
ncbi:MAG TPA: sulfotransferase [Chloroflexota bacterium]|jgi:hypothetical protein|nr:sulfotransferase [Chloroflexota bacterium]